MSSFQALSRNGGLAAAFDAVAEFDASVVGVAMANGEPDADMDDAVELATSTSLESGLVVDVAAEVLSAISRHVRVFMDSRHDQVVFFQTDVGGPVVEFRRLGPKTYEDQLCLLGHEMSNRMLGPHEQSSFRVATEASFDEDFGPFVRLIEDYFDLAPSKRRPFLDELVQRRSTRSDAALIAGELMIYRADRFQLCAEQCGLMKYWGQWYASQKAIANLELSAVVLKFDA